MKRTAFSSMILISFLLAAFGNLAMGTNSFQSIDDERDIANEGVIPITSNDDFFKTAIDFFDIDPITYRLVVTGEVYNPLSLTLDEIKAMPVTSEIVRLTCIAYKNGATSFTGVANWTGVRLSHILDLAEINREKAVDITFQTADLSSKGYSTSLTIEEAYWDDVILAYEMNEELLPKDHGFPLRLCAPRMFGYKWIKWVVYINVTTFDHLGFWENLGYDDSPIVDLSDLPIYYSTSPNTDTPESTKSAPWPFFDLFLLALVTVSLGRMVSKVQKTRLGKEKKEKS